MQNRAHFEPIEKRIERFQNNPPYEAIDTLLNSLDNFFNNEIRITLQEEKEPQTSLMFMGIHAVALTVSKILFNKSGSDGYKHFLKDFIDGDSDDTKFSEIANLIHDWRNVLAHQWLSAVGYKIAYDYKLDKGWIKDNGVVRINPRIYLEHYLLAFRAGGKIWQFLEMLNPKELEEARNRIVKKFLRE